MIRKINELGRSMVEILGVLAVVGVLSIGAIQGYRYAFNKYQANETINELNIRVNDISFRMDQLIENNFVGIIDMDMGDTTKTGYPVVARTHPQYIDYFELFVSNVPTDICKQMLQSNWNLPYSTFVNVTPFEGDVSICEEEPTVTIAYEFYKDLLPDGEVPENEQHETQRCNHANHCKCGSCDQQTGLCFSDCTSSEACVRDINDARWYKCCPKSNVSGEYCCESVDANGSCCDSGNICCPSDAPLKDANGRCQPCDGLAWYNMTGIGERCTQICPDRFLLNGKECGIPCGKDLPMLHTDKICYGCDTPKPIALSSLNGDCTTLCPNRKVGGEKNAYCVLNECPEDKPILLKTGECMPCDAGPLNNVVDARKCVESCPNRVIPQTKYGYNFCASKCPADKPLMDYYGNCHSCTTTASVDVDSRTSACKASCPNRVLKDPYYCIMPPCPADKPLMAFNGTCHDCETETAILLSGVIGGTCTEVCPTRQIGGKNMAYCVKEACTPEKPLSDTTGKCYPCDTTASIPISALSDTCTNLCPDRKVGGSNNAYCVLKECPADKPILLQTGECKPCDAPALDNVVDARKCVESCPNRVIPQHKHGYNFCAPKCPAETPLMSYHGKCFSCNVNDAVDVDNRESTCNQDCPNRIVRPEYYCVKSCSGTTPLMDTSYLCNDCNTDKAIPIKTLNGNCSTLCPNRVIGGSNNAYCIKAGCPSDKPLRLKNGTCVACGTTGPVKDLLNPNDCSTLCSGHTIASSLNPNTCMPPCPTDKPLQDTAGNCYSCNHVSDVNIDGLPAGYCSKTCINRDTVDKRCVRLKCQDGYFEDVGGNCYPCNIATPIDVAGDEAKCTICLNRKVEGNYCVF